jgi:SAM-dependent methyltransferase
MRRHALTDAEYAAIPPRIRDPYTPEYFKAAECDHGPASALFGDVLWDLFRPRSAVDLGCGCGQTLAALERHGVEVQAVDASEAAAPFIARHSQRLADEMIIHDLSQPLVLPRRYDLCISTECLEHLPPDSSEIVVRSICAAAPRAVITACGPTGRNPLHTNEQPFPFWIKLFSDAGFALAVERTGALRRIMRGHQADLPPGVPLVPSWYYGEYIGVFEES